MRGFSLIETLIALVVLSIGLLGIAVLQVEGVKSSQTALLRTKAVLLAADMADRIRANAQGDYRVGAAAVAAPGVSCADDSGSQASICSPQQMADFDIWMWKSMLASDGVMGLPEGTGEITRDDATLPPTHTISVSWSERGSALNHTLAMQYEPDESG